MAASEDCESQLPLCLLIDDEHSDNPDLANLLKELKKYIDSSGMSIALAQPLEEARKIMQAHLANWFPWGALYWFVWEVLLRSRADPSFQDQKFLETLEQQLLVEELKKLIILCMSQPEPCTFVLGLETQHLTKFLPLHQDLEQVQKKLPAEVGKFLKASCVQLLSYCHPDSVAVENVETAAQMIMLDNLAEHLAIVKQNLKEARAQEEELNRCLEQHKDFHLQVLSRCLGSLRRLAREFRLGVQSELDQFYVRYMEIKSCAFLLRIWVEKMRILLKTYPPEVVNVHRMIRDELEGRLSKEERDLALFRDVLPHYESMGPEFEKVVDEYTKLRAIIRNRQWMLAELDKC